jgi:hypothetical protein
MDLEIHVKSVQRDGLAVVVVADGFLFVDSLRVYAVSDLRMRIKPAP